MKRGIFIQAAEGAFAVGIDQVEQFATNVEIADFAGREDRNNKDNQAAGSPMTEALQAA